jgi:prepilin-type N-terminal cleavage/methylation domain-containing protein
MRTFAATRTGTVPAHLPKRRAFSLLELMVVVSIIGLLAAISVPAIKGMSQGKALSSGHQQLHDDLNRARQEALRLRSTVYVVFTPTNVWGSFSALQQRVNEMVSVSGTAPERFREQALRTFTNIALGTYHGYALLVEREVGSQPGRAHPKYLGPGWQTLPDGVIFSPRMLLETPALQIGDRENHIIHSLPVRDFSFPIAEFPGDLLPAVPMRFIAFGPDGRLAVEEMNLVWRANGRNDLTLPPLSELTVGVAQGSVFIARLAATPGQDLGPLDPSVPPDVIETPRDNATNNRVVISSLTGRSKILKAVLP